jgi:hypothetical protein
MGLKYLYVPSGVKAGKAYAVFPEIINTEELTNGNFEQGSTGWTLSGVQNANNYAVFSNGKLVLRNDGSSSGVSQDILTSGKSYDVELYVSEIVGNGFKVNVGAGINYEITTTGRIVFTIKATSSIFYLYRSEENPQSVNGGTIEVVSVLETGADFSDFTRSSAGSRVDKNGFINTGLGLGSEEVVNGSFDSSASWFTTIATISNGRATFIDATGAFSNVRQPNVLATNKTYEVIIDVTINSGGGFKIQDGNSNTYKQITESGVYTFRFTSIGASSSFYISRNLGGVAYNMYVESVSVREVTDVNTNVPRLDYTDGGCPSLLLEPTSTNYVEYSEDFTQSYWSKQGTSSITSSTTISPDGSFNADTLSGATGTDVSGSVLRVNVGLSVESTLSIYCKSLGSTNLTIYIRDGANGSVGSESILLTDEWQRVVLTKDPNNGQVFFGNTNGDVAIYGAQLEQQSYETSYIPTFGAASTRAADNPNSTGDLSSVVNSYPFSMYVHSKYVGGNRFTLAFSNTSVDNQYYTISVVDDEVRLDARANGTSERLQSGITLNEGDKFKAAIVMESDTIGKICVSGGSVLYKNNFSLQSINSSIKHLIIGQLRIVNDTGDRLPVFEARLYDEALSDADIEELTSWKSFNEMAQALNYVIE